MRKKLARSRSLGEDFPLDSDAPPPAVVRKVRSVLCRRSRFPHAERFDPLEVLGPDLAHSILTLLEPKDLARCTALSHNWCQVAADDRLWGPLCDSLWDKKESVAPAALANDLKKIDAYRISWKDGQRNVVTVDDLCDNDWECSFRENPFWGGLPPMRRYFSRNGMISAGEKDLMYRSRTFTWCIVTEGRRKLKRVVVEVGTFPVLHPQRRPDWGWTMRNDWVTYNSIGRKA